MAGIGSESVHAQDRPTHGTVQSVSGQTVTVELTEGYRVEAGTEGTVLVTKTTFGQETTVEQGKLTVEGVDGRTVTARLTSGEKIKGGQTVSFASVRSVGTLSVTAQPRGASVSVDGSPVGEAPVETTMETGTRTVRATSEKCPAASKQVGVERGMTRQVELRLDCPTGTLIVRTDPAEAAVYVDGERLGTGTVEQTVDEGTHRLAVRLSKYQPRELTVRVSSGETVRRSIELSKTGGELTVTTDPEGATVFAKQKGDADFDALGEAPLREHALAPGMYQIRAQKGAYESTVKKVTLSAGTKERFRLNLSFSMQIGKTLHSPNPEEDGVFGVSVSEVKDTNGDDVPDILVATNNENARGYQDAGKAYLLSAKNGQNLQTLVSPNVEEGGGFGYPVSGAGDVNGDGRPDLLVGAYFETARGYERAGRAYLVDGADGSVLRTFISPNPQENSAFGFALSGIGDLTGDGVPDLAVGAPTEERVYLIDGVDGRTLHEIRTPSQSGIDNGFSMTCSEIGDIDEDGVPDLAVGSRHPTVSGQEEAGRVYVISGDTGEIIEQLVSPNIQRKGWFGSRVSGIGDVNGDSVPDLIVGAMGETAAGDKFGGRAYLFSGADGQVLHTLVSPNVEEEGFFGKGVSGIGDVTGDGVSDLAVGASGEERVYVMDGSSGETLEGFSNPDGGGYFGEEVSKLGDVDGDGIPDFVVGDSAVEVRGVENAGKVYVITTSTLER